MLPASGPDRASRLAVVGLLLIGVALPACGGSTGGTSRITKIVPRRVAIPPVRGYTASFDIMAVDQPAHRMYLSDHITGGVDVVDLSTGPGKYLKTIHLGVNVKGVAVAEDLKRVFTGNTDATVAIIDVDPASPAADTPIARVKVGGTATDELVYDPKDKKVYVANSADGYVSVIDPGAAAVTRKLSDLGKLEGLAYDEGAGRVYVASSDRDVIYTIDASSDRIVATSAIGAPCVPHGIAVNPETGQGILGCSTSQPHHVVAWDFRQGTALKTFTEAGGGDMAIYDPGADRFYFASDTYTTPEMAIFSGSPVSFLTAIPTGEGSKSAAYDETHRLIYTWNATPFEAALWSYADPS